MSKRSVAFRVVLLLTVLYLFFVSIKLMGSAFKLFGSGFTDFIFAATTNPFVGLFIGILATSMLQSSSATTSIIVGLTASGALSVGTAIPIIMGANIGTSVTNTMVSLAHITKKGEFKRAFEVATVHDFFNLIAVLVLFPLELMFHSIENLAVALSGAVFGNVAGVTFDNPLSMIVSPAAGLVKDLVQSNALILLIVAVTLLFLSLRTFVKLMKPLTKSDFTQNLHRHVLNYPLRTFGLGVGLTILVQSSSVTTSLVVPLAGVGIFALDRIFPYIIGANIGTTVTALLASLVTGSPAAVTVACAHFIFNCVGAILVYPIRHIPEKMSIKLAKIAQNARALPVAYIFFIFYAIPALIIFAVTQL